MPFIEANIGIRSPLTIEGRPEAPGEEASAYLTIATRRYFESADKDFDHPTPIQGKWRISGIALSRAVLEKIYSKNAIRLLGLELKTP